MAINVCTRGNADAIICWLVLLCVRLLQRGCIIQSGAVYGIAVHFRIFPVILAPTFLLLLNRPSIRAPLGYPSSALVCQATFSLIAAFTFFALTGVFWLLYGYPFLHESYLYHILSRLDPRHNFSPYFYALYITPSVAWTILFAVSQITVQLSMSWRFASDFVFCACIQTWAFVTFNKVCTAQYFLWYLSLLPCAATSTTISSWGGTGAAAAWFAAEIHWLLWAYYLEFEGKNVFFNLWIAGLIFFAANLSCIIYLVRSHAGKARFEIVRHPSAKAKAP